MYTHIRIHLKKGILFKRPESAVFFSNYSQLLSKFSFQIWNLLKVIMKFSIFNITTEQSFLSPLVLFARTSISTLIKLLSKNRFCGLIIEGKFFCNYLPIPYSKGSIWHFSLLFHIFSEQNETFRDS